MFFSMYNVKRANAKRGQPLVRARDAAVLPLARERHALRRPGRRVLRVERARA